MRFMLDDLVCILCQRSKLLTEQRLIFIGIGGGVTGDIQISDTDIHSPLKAYDSATKA